MTKTTAKALFDAKYKKHMTWDEIWEILGEELHRYTIHEAWKKYGFEVPKKYRHKNYDELVSKLTVDTAPHKG